MLKTHFLETSTLIRKAREYAVRCEELHHETCDVTDLRPVHTVRYTALVERADRGLYKVDPYRL